MRGARVPDLAKGSQATVLTLNSRTVLIGRFRPSMWIELVGVTVEGGKGARLSRQLQDSGLEVHCFAASGRICRVS